MSEPYCADEQVSAAGHLFVPYGRIFPWNRRRCGVIPFRSLFGDFACELPEDHPIHSTKEATP